MSSLLLTLNKILCLQLIKKETLQQVFSCEFCEISKNTFSYRTPPVAASGIKIFDILSEPGFYECPLP